MAQLQILVHHVVAGLYIYVLILLDLTKCDNQCCGSESVYSLDLTLEKLRIRISLFSKSDPGKTPDPNSALWYICIAYYTVKKKIPPN